MLTQLSIRDFAIIDSLNLELAAGLTALTGETGAGKSILVDALGLVLGDRADSGTVRHGADKADISAEFDLTQSADARAWLAEQALDDGETTCHIRRVIGADGRSRGFINGRSVPVQSLKELGDCLVDIHGQHEHQSLLKRDTQLRLLDSYGGHDDLLQQTGIAFAAWQACDAKLARLQRDAADRDHRLDVLRFQVRELDALAPRAGEYAELEAAHHRLANAGRLLEGTQRALALSYENDESTAYSLLGAALHELGGLRDTDPQLAGISDAFNNALITLQEAADELRRYVDALEMDPEQRDFVEARLASIQQLSRKHHCEADALPGLLEELRAELEALETAEVSLGKLEQERAAYATRYREIAGALHAARTATAAKLGKLVSAAMQELGMPGGRFQVNVRVPDSERFGARGQDQIEFTVSANPGQPLAPLAKVASGGELSRISLAIQVIAADAAAVPAMVFDEVDAGIGGGVAETVGQRLRELGGSRQVLCVTHLPQVAAQAHRQLKVEKLASANSTRTTITPLDDEARVEELARMLGGVKITDTTREHAREMLQRAAGAKKKRA